MTNPILTQNNIFVLSLSDFSSKSDIHLLYAPLSGVCTLATTDEITTLQEDIASYPHCNNKELVELFTSGRPEQAQENAVATVNDFLHLYVLPTFKCNFACSYCFSAEGRAQEEVKKGDLFATLDFFISKDRIKSDALSISYLGGGEPLLSWDTVRAGVEYASDLADKQNIKLYTTIVTNGSRITDEIAQILKKHNVLVRVSFEILPEIQAIQRGKYPEVCCGLDILDYNNVNHMVRSMITPDNVMHMVRMIDELRARFPKVKSVLFDPITSPQVFCNPQITEAFYNNYFHQFLAARKYGKRYGIEVANATLRNLDIIVERYCAGELCLTPLGTITMCHQISSPREKGYDEFVYGRLTNGKLTLDTDKFLELKNRYTIYDNPNCQDCSVKWTCGGGCTQQRRQYPEEILQVICATEKRLTTAFLLERLSGNLEISDYIAQYEPQSF